MSYVLNLQVTASPEGQQAAGPQPMSIGSSVSGSFCFSTFSVAIC